MKYLFVDFDDTLCIHPEPIKTENFMFEEKKDACQKFYGGSRLNIELLDYLEHFKAEGVEIILLSACNSKMLEIKKEWCKVNCPNIFDDYIGSSVDLTKTEIIKAYASFKKENLLEMALIDDNENELQEATMAGIPAIDSRDFE